MIITNIFIILTKIKLTCLKLDSFNPRKLPSKDIKIILNDEK